MVYPKIHLKAVRLIYAVVILFCICAVELMAQEQWQTFTSFEFVRQARFIDGRLYLVTSGGLLEITDFNTPSAAITNQDGLGTNDITDIMQDASGVRWVSGFGRLVRLNGSQATQYLFFDNDDDLFSVLKIADDVDQLWLGTSLGLVLFSKTIDDGQIQDSYQLFGNLNPSPPVYDILLKQDSIWIATASGLAVGIRTNPALLKSPSNWTVFGLGNYPELSSDTVLNVVAYQSLIHVATVRGVFQLTIDSLLGDTSFTAVPMGAGLRVRQMKIENDSLFVYYENSGAGRIGYINNGVVTNLSTTGLTSPPITGAGDGSIRWAGLFRGGVFANLTGTYQQYPYTGLPSNDISGITVNRDGVLAAGFRRIAMAKYENDAWLRFTNTVRDGSTFAFTDSSDNIWLGTVGHGLYLLDGDSLIKYDDTNSTLRGNIDDLPFSRNFVVVRDMATDGRYIYLANYRTINDHALVIGDLNNLNSLTGWDSVGVPNGISDIYAVSVAYSQGFVTVGMESDGLYRCFVGTDPLTEDIECTHLTRENSLLISNTVRVVRYSPEGILWVGTNVGLSRYDPGIDRFIDVNLPAEISSDISDLEFDGRGNLWVGTKSGLARFDAVTGQFEVFNTFNTEIASDVINDVKFDAYTGDVYVATTAGYSFLSSQIGPPTADVEKTIAFPNPFVIDDDGDRLNFNYAGSGNVRIFSVAGELVRDIPVNKSWDGTNEKSKPVASGVYVFVISDSNGNIGKGKFLLVRR